MVRFANIIPTLILTVGDFLYTFGDSTQVRGAVAFLSSVDGNEFLRSRGMTFDSSWQVWSNLLALFLIAFMVFFLCYFRLRFTKTY